VVSSLKNKPLPAKLVVFGEVGLAGEVRPVQRGQERLREAAKLGFTHALIPHANKPRQAIAGLEVMAVRRVEEAVVRMRDFVTK
jgi:DNA repair protein RadA/Sms